MRCSRSTLTRIAQHGRDGFYTGATAQAILATEHKLGGTMTAQDLRGFHPEWVTPLHVDYRGWTVYELPPNSQGIGALMMLQIMSRFPLGSYGFHATQSLHVMMEAKQLAYADVLRYVGDPRLANIPVAQMLDSAHAAARAGLIDPARATCSEPPSEFSSITDKKGGDTIYLTVIDAAGNIVSLIQSNYEEFGSGLVPTGTGFVLQDRGALFTLQPGMANTLAPHKRLLHTLIPAFMQKDSVRIGFGIMGGWNQAQAHAQFVSNIADYGMTIQQALEAGRFTKPGFSGCDFDIESRIPQAVMGTAGGIHLRRQRSATRRRRDPAAAAAKAVTWFGLVHDRGAEVRAKLTPKLDFHFTISQHFRRALGAPAGPREGLSPPLLFASLHGCLRAGRLADRWHSAWRIHDSPSVARTSEPRAAQATGERAAASRPGKGPRCTRALSRAPRIRHHH